MTILKFWAKTSESSLDLVMESTAKPVIHHLLDVAAVAYCWLEHDVAWRVRIGRMLSLDPSEVSSVIAFAAGLHDLGKFSVPFQSKSLTHWPADVLGPVLEYAGKGAHWELTASLLSDPSVNACFEAIFGNGCGLALEEWIAVIAGHHGVAPSDEFFDAPAGRIRTALTTECCKAAKEAIETLERLTRVQPSSGVAPNSLQAIKRSSVLINGVITLSDWVGSDGEFFPVEQPAICLDRYWQDAQIAARRALQHKGLLSQSVRAHPSYGAMGLACADRPRPMQQATVDLALDDGPQLVIIEETTGAGKTEAAILLAARMMAAGKAEGLYFALPTMATANAMHERLTQAHKGLFDQGQAHKPSLVLLHGKADLARRLATKAPNNGVVAEPDVASWCNAWMTSNRRLGLLADVGAGTVDQAFLTVLKKKHVSMRQAALSRRVLVIDEAHSFDAYMGEELETLLAVQANNGGSAIILSATLSENRRQELVNAFIGEPSLSIGHDTSSAYPLLTIAARSASADGAKVRQIPIAFDERLRRRVTVKRLANREAGLALALEVAAKGGAVAIICNAVDEAIAVYQQLCEQIANPENALLFHARFALCDRMAIEQRVLSLFGKISDPAVRRGKVIVSTQVIEQSLDLDFDLVISDLAPVDLLIQRAGRLWRHMEVRLEQDRPVPEPVLAVVSPDPTPAKVLDDQWLEPVLGRAAFVYRDSAIMWRSAAALFALGHIATPDDLRPLLAQVYGPDELGAPACLRAAAQRAEGEAHGHRTQAHLNVHRPEAGYAALGPSPGFDEEIGTRLGEPTVTIRLAKRRAGALVPWADDGTLSQDDSRLAWELSDVTLRQPLWRRCEDSALVGEEAEAVRERWPVFERGMPLVDVGATGGWLTYTREMGFFING